MLEHNLHHSPWIRWLLAGTGLLALLLGVVGIFVPVLPTTPFILLAAFCFARSSARFHRWLLDHHISGPLIRDWALHRSIPLRIKRLAYGLMALSFGSSILIVPLVWLKVLLAVLGLVLAWGLWRITTR